MPDPQVKFVALSDGINAITNVGTIEALNSIYDDAEIPADAKDQPFLAILKGAQRSGRLVPGVPAAGDVQKYFGIEGGLVVLFDYQGPDAVIRGLIPGIKLR